MARPEVCAYCEGAGVVRTAGIVGSETEECGFCDNGVPLDSQEDWDRTWGRILPD